MLRFYLPSSCQIQSVECVPPESLLNTGTEKIFVSKPAPRFGTVPVVSKVKYLYEKRADACTVISATYALGPKNLENFGGR